MDLESEVAGLDTPWLEAVKVVGEVTGTFGPLGLIDPESEVARLGVSELEDPGELDTLRTVEPI